MQCFSADSPHIQIIQDGNWVKEELKVRICVRLWVPSALLLMDHTLQSLLSPVYSRGLYSHFILGPGNVSVVDLSLAVAILRATCL